MTTLIERGEPPIAPRLSEDLHIAVTDESLQLRTILVPLDFSEASLQAVNYTLPLAEFFGAAVHLVHVQPVAELTTLTRAGRFVLDAADAIGLMQDRLAEIQEQHDVQFRPDHCHAVSGRPFEEICKVGREIKADLIVLPTHGYTGVRHLILGSTAEKVIRFAPCPVLVLRGGPAPSHSRFRVGKIVVPVDFSRCSMAAVRYGARLARATKAKLSLFHVVFPYQHVVGFDRMSADSTPYTQHATHVAEEQMRNLTSSRFLKGIECENEIRVGNVVEEIACVSHRADVDLLVTATHGGGGFRHAFLGSTAEHLIRYAESPVITVPSRD